MSCLSISAARENANAKTLLCIDNSSFDGFRKSLEKEFSSIYVFNLRGGIKGKSGDNAKREGQNVFDIMTGVAITILVKNPKQCTDMR